MTEVAAIVLAAGKSKRMNSALPKVLHPVLGVPLVVYVLEAAVEAGVRRVVLVANPESEAPLARACDEWLQDRRARGGAPIQWAVAVQTTPRGTADAVLAARKSLEGFKGTALVLCGDAPCVSAGSLQAVLAEHRQRGAHLSVLSGDLPDPTGYGRIVRSADALESSSNATPINDIVEEKDATPPQRSIREINAGILALEMPALWDTLGRIEPSRETGELYLTRAVPVARTEGKRVQAVRAAVPEDVMGVNDRAQLAEVTAVLRRRINLGHMKAGVTIVDPESAFIDPRARIGRDTTVLPFVVIEGPCTIGSDVRLGPFAHVRGGSQVADGCAVGNYVEVVRSRLGPGSRALHLAYVGDATLGEDVNVGAGTVFANYDGKNRNKSSVGAHASLGAGTVLVAPCEVGADAKTGAGAVVTARSSVPAGETWVGVPARTLKHGRVADGSR